MTVVPNPYVITTQTIRLVIIYDHRHCRSLSSIIVLVKELYERTVVDID